MNAAYEMAKLLKVRENLEVYSPFAGTIEQLPDVKIRVSSKIVLGEDDISSIVELNTQNSDGKYVNKGKRVYLLRMYNMPKKFLVIGVEHVV